jgi:RimJ/RimL family protein N-acetyltransferase
MALESLTGSRIGVRVLRDEHHARVEAWYGEAASAAYQDRTIEELHSGSLVAITPPGDDAPIGLIEYEVRDGWLDIPFIALAKPYRGWGYGSEALRLVEKWAVREGVASRFRAAVDVRNGLGLYFWLRLGYRPAVGEFDWPSGGERDKMPMVREASGGVSGRSGD